MSNANELNDPVSQVDNRPSPATLVRRDLRRRTIVAISTPILVLVTLTLIVWIAQIAARQRDPLNPKPTVTSQRH